MQTENKGCQPERSRTSIILSILFLVIGTLGLTAMVYQNKDLKAVVPEERSLPVSVASVQRSDYPVTLQGYGEVKVVNNVIISADVDGALIYVSPKLDPGEVFEKDELLFRLETSKLESSKKELEATVKRLRESMAQKREQHTIDLQRHAIAKRNLELSLIGYQRTRSLYAEHQVSTKSELDKAESDLNAAKEQLYQLAEAIQTYPHVLLQAECEVAEATAKLEVVLQDLAKCEIRSPITGRVKEASVEAGKYVEAGQTLATLADDSMLEMEVALDGRDVRQWLRFEEQSTPRKSVWFHGLSKVACKVRWVEDTQGYWSGRLHRAVRYNPTTLTLTLAVRIDTANEAPKGNGSVPLAEGMFCRVEIPGKTLRDVVRLPKLAVTYDQTVHVSYNNRLRTVPVQVLRTRGDFVFIGNGLNNGDHVIISRLVNPFENMKLQLISTNKGVGKCVQQHCCALRP